MRKRAVVAIATVFTLLLLVPSVAPAKTVTFSGEAKTDALTIVEFDAQGRMKDGKFKAKEISNVTVDDQQFTCYRADGSSTGITGRTTYPYQRIPPMKVKYEGRRDRIGRFSGSYELTNLDGTTTFERYEFKGRIGPNNAAGWYQSQRSEAGISRGYCGDNKPMGWEAKAKR